VPVLRSERRRFLRSVAAVGLVGWNSVCATRADAKSLREGEPAPPAALVTLDGQRISTAELLGQVVILKFWATWCEPCRKELPLLSDYAQRHAEEGFRVLAFSLDAPDDIAKVRKAAQGFHFPVGLLAASSAPGYGRIWRLPVSFTIDRHGRLAINGWKQNPGSWTTESLERIVTPMLR